MEDIFILIAEDDADDRFLLQAAFEENGFTEKLEFVENGVEVLDYLHNLSGPKKASYLPSFILMDLNMPKKDGREVLKELKESPGLRTIPIIVFSTTSNEQEKKRCYELGANGYITKPTSFEALMQTVADLRNNWINVGSMPIS